MNFMLPFSIQLPIFVANQPKGLELELPIHAFLLYCAKIIVTLCSFIDIGQHTPQRDIEI